MGGRVVEQREEQWEDSLATQSRGENELSQTNRSVREVCVGVVPRVQSKFRRALHAHDGKKILPYLWNLENNTMKRALVRPRGTREKDAMVFVECLGFSKEDTIENILWREASGRSLGMTRWN